MADTIPFAVPVDAFRDLIRAVVREVLAETVTSGNPVVLMTESEAAALLGMSPDTLRSERRLGRITYRQSGRKIRFSPEDLEKYSARIRG